MSSTYPAPPKTSSTSLVGGHGLLARHGLHDGREHAQERLLVLREGRRLLAPQQRHDAEREQQRAVGLGLHRGERVEVQRLVRQRRPEGHALLRIVPREREAAAHREARADGVPRARDVEHRADVLDAVGQTDQTAMAGVPSSVSSAVGTMRVPSLSFNRFTRMSRSRPPSSRVST